MKTAEKITCPRCKGTGILDWSPVVYAGIPGGCFQCAGYGQVYKDKFYQKFGVGKKFYGVTWSRYLNKDNPNNGVFKMLCVSKPEIGERIDYFGNVADRIECVEITEEQARRFWNRYGDETILGGVRVGDFDGSKE